jgi:surface antigen
MRGWVTSAKSLFIGSFFILTCQVTTPAADAMTNQHRRQPTDTAQTSGTVRHAKVAAHGRHYGWGGGISCVPFARNDSGISIAGNAWQWWDDAAGTYARGSVPEAGSVLTFRANGRMRLGHVAVVSRVINAREIEIEHANWWGPGMHGGVARNIPVVDVSEANDWTAVRVGLGQSGEFGSVYPIYGFIYNRPDTGVMLVNL